MLVAAESVTTTMKHDGVDVDSVVIVVVKLGKVFKQLTTNMILM